MGPLRTAWTFPYTGKELIEACKEREAGYKLESFWELVES